MKIIYNYNVLLIFIKLILPTNVIASEAQLSVNQLVQLNHFSPIESAASHGSIGYNLAIGLQQTDNIDNQGITVGRLYVTRGFTIPLDLGFSVGTAFQSAYTLLSAYGQYSIFEKFKWPSLSIRGSGSTILGHERTNRTGAIALAASYGFLRYLNIFTYSSLEYAEIGESQKIMSLFTNASSSATSVVNLYYALGIEVKLLNPLYKLSLERSRNLRDQESFVMKLGYGF